MHLGRALQVLNAFFDGVIDVAVNQIAEGVEVNPFGVGLCADGPEDLGLGATNGVADLGIVVLVPDAAVLAKSDAVALVKLR